MPCWWSGRPTSRGRAAPDARLPRQLDPALVHQLTRAALAWCREPAQPRRAGALGGHRRSRRRNAQTGQRGAGVRRARSAGGREQRPRRRRRPCGRTDHPAAAQPAGLRRPDVDRSRALLPDARAGDAARRAASQPAPDALGHDAPGIRPSTSACSCTGSMASSPGCTCSFATRAKMARLKRAMHAALRLVDAAGLPSRLAAAPARGRRRQAARDAAQLPPGHRRRRRLLARHDRRVPGGAVHAWGLVLSAAVLGSGADRAGAVSRGRSRRRAGHGHRLLLRRSGASACSGSRTSRSSRSITSRSAARSTIRA